MPLFARRRIQAMLDELGPVLSCGKAKDLLARLARPRQPDQVIAAEMELGLLWAIKQVAHIEIEPRSEDGHLPDCASNDMFGGVPAIIEITTASDADFSGDMLMRRAFAKIGDFANTVRRGAKQELSLLFRTRAALRKGKTRRVRCVTTDFELNDEMRGLLRAWLLGPMTDALRLQSADIDVTIRWQAGRKVRTVNYWSTLLPLAHDIEANPVFRAVVAKKKQLRHAPRGVLRCVFLADGGCELLRNLDRKDPLRSTFSGRAVIEHAMKQAELDVVCVFAPSRRYGAFSQSSPPLTWMVNVIALPQIASHLNISRVEALAARLPPPRFEAHQARSLQEQARFQPNALGWHLGTMMTWKAGLEKDEVMVKISARALQEFLAGRLTREQFDRQLGDRDSNLFARLLTQGYTLAASRLESTGLDEDDDQIVLEFARDPAAAGFHIEANGHQRRREDEGRSSRQR